MSKKKILLLLGVAVGAFMLGYGALALAYPSPGPYGRSQYYGYFLDQRDTSGDFVLQNIYSDPPYGYSAFSPSMNTASEFITEITRRLSGSTWDRTGAAFLVQTMIGSSRSKPPTAAQFNTWKTAVNAYAAAGKANFNTNYCYSLNTYYQRDRYSPSSPTDDDAFYDDSGCSPAIVFTNPDGSHYAIRRQCGNPIGSLKPLTVLGPQFTIDGQTKVSDNTPPPGGTITFDYYIRNQGPDSTSPTPITWKAVNSKTGAIIKTASAGALARGGFILKYTESVLIPAATPQGTQICRRTDATPHTQAGGTYVGTPECATVGYGFTLKPTVKPTVKDSNGVDVTTSGIAEPGDTITFDYIVKNSGLGDSLSATCGIHGITKSGYYNFTPPAYDVVSDPGYVPPATGCPRTFTAGSNVTIATESVPAASIVTNKTLCRSLVITPSVPAGAPATDEACISIGSKPYVSIRGGDASAGNPQTVVGVCGVSPNAAIVSWNKENGPNFDGAGVQFAALAVNDIYDVASAQGNAGGAAAGSGLAFANKGVYSGGLFGGNVGTPDCIPDYYGNLPAAANSLTVFDVSGMPTGTYKYTAGGDITLKGNIGGGKQVAIYVTGNVLITDAGGGNGIGYPGAWTANNAPLFELIVKGNIYISKDVKTLNGLFVAQPNGATGGTIYTCAAASLPAIEIKTTDVNYNSLCNNGLTINGSFVANQVQLLRTAGTLSAGVPAEVFNYGPALWMAIPPDQPSNNSYDSITSLPPIL